MLKRLRDRLSERDKVLFKLSLWTVLVVWMVFFFAYSIVMAKTFALRSPYLFGTGLWGQVMTWVLPVWTVFTSLLTIVLMSRYAYRKLSPKRIKGGEDD